MNHIILLLILIFKLFTLIKILSLLKKILNAVGLELNTLKMCC
jgi:hypothetical protein